MFARIQLGEFFPKDRALPDSLHCNFESFSRAGPRANLLRHLFSQMIFQFIQDVARLHSLRRHFPAPLCDCLVELEWVFHIKFVSGYANRSACLRRTRSKPQAIPNPAATGSSIQNPAAAI